MITDTITTALECPRDGRTTRLTCGRCGTPICPACLVRTAVGIQCPACAGTTAGRRRRPAWVTAAVVVVAAAGAVGAVVAAGGPRLPAGGGQPDGPAAAVEQPAAGGPVSVGPFAVTVGGFECAPDTAVRPGMPAQRCEAVLQVRNDTFAVQAFPASLQRATEGFRRFVPTTTGSTTVDPGATVEVTVAFRLPQAMQPSRLELRASAEQTPVRVSLRA